MTFGTAFILQQWALLMYLSAYRSCVCLCWTTRTYPDDQHNLYRLQESPYFAKSALPDTPQEREMKEVDLAIEINGGWFAACSTHGRLEGVVKGRKRRRNSLVGCVAGSRQLLWQDLGNTYLELRDRPGNHAYS